MIDTELFKMTDGVTKQLTSYNPRTQQKTISIEPNQSKILIDNMDCGIITRMWFTFPGWFWRHWDVEAINDPSVLRLTILKIYFDGSNEPSVEAPIGDFFGIGHCEYKHYTSRFLGMSSGGFYSYFPMPFQNGFKLEIVNLHPAIRIDMFYNINISLYNSIDPTWGRFHAAFHCGERAGNEELEILNVKGKGHYSGCSLSIQGGPLQYLSYLEAPEYIYIDGNEELTMYGTGMEDYFNGGWYFRSGEFYCDTHGMPLKDTLRSMTSMFRFHDQDRINFQKSIRMLFLNPWAKERLKPFIFSSVAYYYLECAMGTCYKLPSNEQLKNLYRIRDVDFQSVP